MICIGTGNEAAGAGHTSGWINDEEEAVIELAVQERQPSLNVQIWKSYTDVIDIALISPSGYRIGPIQEVQRFFCIMVNQVITAPIRKYLLICCR